MPDTCIVSGNLLQLSNGIIANGQIIFELANIGTGNPITIPSTGIFPALKYMVTSAADGSFTQAIWGNDNISPMNTIYNVTFRDSCGNEVGPIMYSITGATADLNTISAVSSTIPPVLAPGGAIGGTLAANQIPIGVGPDLIGPLPGGSVNDSTGAIELQATGNSVLPLAIHSHSSSQSAALVDVDNSSTDTVQGLVNIRGKGSVSAFEGDFPLLFLSCENDGNTIPVLIRNVAATGAYFEIVCGGTGSIFIGFDDGSHSESSVGVDPTTGNLEISSGSGVLVIGESGSSVVNGISMNGGTSGKAVIQTPLVAGTPNPINLPISTGTSGQCWITDGANPQQTSWGGAKFLSATHTPSSASDTGITGQIAWDSGFIYICIATNTWKRVAIATW